jgi:uncharacterized protein (TIGR03083 family)
MSAQPRAASTTGPELVAAFDECWTSLVELGRSLDETQWASPALCPGWTAKDALIHLTSAELGFLGWAPSPEPPFAVMADHARRLRGLDGAAVLGEFEAVVARRREQIAGFDEVALDAVGWSPAGPGPHRRYLEIRVFDTWAHEQDIRVPLGLTGHLEGRGPTLSLDEAHLAFGYLVGKRAGFPDGSSVTVRVTGPTSRELHAVVEGRARVVDELVDPACVLTVDFATFMLLCCGRIDPSGPLDDGRVLLEGDVGLAERLARNLSFTI